MKRTVLIAGLVVLSITVAILWLVSRWSTFRVSKGSVVSLPCTEIYCSHGVLRIARLSRTAPVPSPTDTGFRDYRLISLRSISGPAATVRIGGVKITGGRGMYADFRSFNPSPPVAMQNVRFTRIDVTMWLVIPLAAIYPIIAFIRAPYRRRALRRRKGLCVNCGYDLTGNVSGICPECGEKLIVTSTPEEQAACPAQQR